MAPKECSLHPRSMLDSMNALREEEEFCDITFVAGQDEIKVHKFVLIAASEYFRAMFSNDTKESKTGIVSFPDTPGDVVKQCINFIYSGKVDFTLDRITDFIKTSDIFCLHNLTDIYVEFLSENVTMENVAEMLSVALLYQKKLLIASIQIFFQENLNAFIESPELKSLSKDILLFLLSLVVNWGKKYEMLKWNAVMTWVKHDMLGRKDAFDDCFQSIDLAFLTRQFISENIICEALVTDSKECLQKIVSHDYALEKCFKVPLACGQQMTGIISCDTKSRTVYRYSQIEDKWSVFSRLPPGISTKCLDIVEHKGIIYVTTGNAVFSYSELKWKKLYENDSEQEYNRCIICGKYIAMVTRGQVVLYELDVGTSSSIEIKRNAVYSCNTFAITSMEECIYVIDTIPGVVNTHTFQINLRTMQSIQISKIPILVAERSAFGYNGTVYAISYYSKEVVFYDDITKEWKFVPGLRIEKYNSECKIHITDKLYIYDKQLRTKIATVELDKFLVSEDEQPPSPKDASVCCMSFSK